MSWKEKIKNINDLFIYCEKWRTKKEIAEKYSLTTIESWHCIKYCKSLWSDFETKTQMGITKRAIAVRTRTTTLKEIGYLK